MLVAPSAAATAPSPTELGRWPYGPATAIARDGDLIWLGGGTTLQAWRFTPPDTLDKIGEVEIADPAREIVVDGNLAYLAVGDEGLQIVDIADPTEPAMVGSVRTRGFANGIAVGNGTAWIAATRSGVRGYDVTDPGSPRLIGAVVPAELTYDVAIGGGVLWAASVDGLHAVDVIDPRRPRVVSTTDVPTPWGLQRVIVRGDVLVTAAFWAGMELYDATEPQRPELIGSIFQWECPTMDVEVVGSTAALLCESYLSIADISDPTRPVELATVEDIAGCTLPEPLAVSSRKLAAGGGDTLIVANDCNGLRVLDLTEPRQPEILLTRETPGHPAALSVLDDHILVASDTDHEGWFRSLDVSNPSTLTLSGGPIGPDFGLRVDRDMAVAGGHAYVSGNLGRIHIFDVTDPVSPSYVTDHPLAADFGIQGLAASTELLIVASSSGELVIHDLVRPTDPIKIGRLDLGTDIDDVAISGSLAFLAGSSAGLTIVDLAEPSAPRVVSNLPVGRARRLGVEAPLVLVAAGHDGLVVVDATTPLVPTEIGRFAVGFTDRVAVRGDVVVVSTYQNEACGAAVRVIDLTDPAHLAERCHLCALDPRFAFVGDLLAVGDRYGGLRLLDLEACLHPDQWRPPRHPDTD